MKLGTESAIIRGDVAADYSPELGLTRFERQFQFSMKDGFTISDNLQTQKPQVFTSLIHADDRIKQDGAKRFIIDPSGVKLRINIVAPEDATAIIEPNILTAAGRPGSVDKGERQERGQRLAISTPTPTSSARFVLHLKVERATRSKSQLD